MGEKSVGEKAKKYLPVPDRSLFFDLFFCFAVFLNVVLFFWALLEGHVIWKHTGIFLFTVIICYLLGRIKV